MDNIIPPEYIEQISQYVQLYQSTKKELMPTSDVYAFSATVSNESATVLQKNVSPIPDISRSRFVKTMSTSNDMEIMGIYNNSTNTERFKLSLDSKLGVSDALGLLQYNDSVPTLNQILFVSSQSMRLTERLDMELKPNDCIIIAFMKMYNDGTQGSVHIEIGCETISTERKIFFIVLMIVLLFAIIALAYSLLNPSNGVKSGFRRRR